MDTFEQIVEKIIKDQELIIGPLALEEAKRVVGIVFSPEGVRLDGNKINIIDQLVARYERLFGEASVQVCKDAAAPLLPNLKTGETPSSLI